MRKALGEGGEGLMKRKRWGENEKGLGLGLRRLLGDGVTRLER